MIGFEIDINTADDWAEQGWVMVEQQRAAKIFWTQNYRMVLMHISFFFVSLSIYFHYFSLVVPKLD